jgi:hypothetical protein
MGYIGHAEIHNVSDKLRDMEFIGFKAFKHHIGSQHVLPNRNEYVDSSAPNIEIGIEAYRNTLKDNGAIYDYDLVIYSDSCYAELKKWSSAKNSKMYQFTHQKNAFYVVQMVAGGGSSV